jgi:hypothetical protein
MHPFLLPVQPVEAPEQEFEIAPVRLRDIVEVVLLGCRRRLRAASVSTDE